MTGFYKYELWASIKQQKLCFSFLIWTTLHKIEVMLQESEKTKEET